MWDTDARSSFWVLGVATGPDTTLLNNPATMGVNFAVPDGASFVVFGSDSAGIEFLPGNTLTVTASFSDGTSATAATRLP